MKTSDFKMLGPASAIITGLVSVVACGSSPSYGQAPASGFVSSRGVRLHYLDWGGSGEPVILVTGLGLTAGVFSDLALKLAGNHRVVAIDRRGAGQSDRPAGGYDLSTLTEDLRVLLDTLGFASAILVGHSMGGWEITEFAARYPERATALVYIDAALDGGPVFDRMQAANPIQRPTSEADLATLEATRGWYRRYFYGFWSPALEADLRVRAETPDMIIQPIVDSLAAHPDYQKPYAHVRAPALALYAFTTVQARWPWLDSLRDSATVAKAQRYLDEFVLPWQSASIDRFRREMPRAIVQRIEGSHYFFINKEAEVLTAIQAFIAGVLR